MRGGLLDCSIQRDNERQGKERSDNCRSGEGRAMALNVLLERVGMFFCLTNCSCQSFYLPPPCMPPPLFNLIQYPLQLLLQFLNEKPLTSCLTLNHSLVFQPTYRGSYM
ncbi:hypothetical protein ES288_D05G227500v1 [Gossypium darwinii]|uniref:Uncharacterized protein n=2 Tax=Gossypium TaxID=3633 RepID=A0A5D2KYI2_GOSTO|nr:hypothetical protein ES288_D05G227500v1 [Gossypium darwinii]TYH72050.1 hypothetical protein ES332_D05G226800v1 [Gossypium tomentosum]